MGLAPSVSHDRPQCHRYFHADLLLERIGAKLVFPMAEVMGLSRQTCLALIKLRAELSDQESGAETSRRFVSPPKGQRLRGHDRVHTIDFQGGYEQSCIGSHMEGGLARYSSLGPDLSLSNTDEILLFLLVDLDLPAIEVSLQSLSHVDLGIADQQIGWASIECMSVSPVAQWADHDQAHGASSRPNFPKHRRQGFIMQGMFFASGKYALMLPGHGCILAQLFWCREGLSVFSVSAFALSVLLLRRSIQTDILACPSYEDDACRKLVEDGPIAEAGIDHGPQLLLAPARVGAETRMQIRKQSCPLRAQPFFFLLPAILLHSLGILGTVVLPLLDGIILPVPGALGFSNRRRKFESNRDGACRSLCLRRPNQQGRMEKTQGPGQVGVEPGRERISQRPSPRNTRPGLTQDRVIHGHYERLSVPHESTGLLSRHIKKLARIPATGGKEAIIRCPALILALLSTNGPTDGAPPQRNQQGQSKPHGTTVSPVVGKTIVPTLYHTHKRRQQCHGVLALGQNRKGVRATANEAILAGDALGQSRHHRLAIQFHPEALGDQGEDVGDVQRPARAMQYVVYHIDMRHTLDWRTNFRPSLNARGLTQAAQGAQLRFGDLFQVCLTSRRELFCRAWTILQ